MILFCGDPHGEFQRLLVHAETTRPDAIVLLGDQTPDRLLAEVMGVWAERTWYILGNHDSDRAEFVRCTRPAHRFRRGSVLRHWTSIFPEDVRALARLHADVLVTHEAPTTHPHGFEVLDNLARDMGVRLVVHGHHHEPCHDAELFGGILVTYPPKPEPGILLVSGPWRAGNGQERTST
ncbi:MAG: metallophosphoesterase [Desulfovibrio aminophilus]|uniref:metallophosphoesterase family protein n=1 Tax=Desulfovibrio aminophilus TaxID=81425 RepID=UPI0039ED7833